MKALVLTNHYPATDAPTRGTYNHNTFRALARYWDLRVVGPIPFWTRIKKPRTILALQRETSFGLDASFPSYFSIPRATFLHGGAAFVSLYPLVRAIRREFPFDLILSTWAYPDAFAAACFAEVSKVPLITTVLGSDVNELPNHRLLGPQIRWSLRRARRVVAVSRAMGERVIELGVPRRNVVVQHNGVEGDRFALRDRRAARDALGVDHDRPMVLYVGNVKVSKGCEVLVEAMSPLVRGHGKGDVELVVVGSGDADALLQQRVAELGLEKNVRLAGRRLHTEVPLWMSACDVFSLPSFNEGCPNVVLEALASGKPVVATNVGGIPELITKDNGLLVPPGDAPALARALNEALDRAWDPAALRASVEFLSWDAVGERYRDLCDEVMAEVRG